MSNSNLILVPTKRTNFSQAEFIKSLINFWYYSYNKTIPKFEQISILYAQWAVETGVGKYCWNYNIGNSKVPLNPTTPIKYMMLSNTWEIINGEKKVFQPPDRQTWFMAFDSLESGVKHHFALLKSIRYRVAWQAVERGSYKDFSRLLKQQGYYTASESSYSSALAYNINWLKTSKIFESELVKFQQYLKSIQENSMPSKDTVINLPERPSGNSKSFVQKILSLFKI